MTEQSVKELIHNLMTYDFRPYGEFQSEENFVRIDLLESREDDVSKKPESASEPSAW